ncbi:MAG: 50S ribosomal protein L21 [Luteimonas sp.]
MYAVLVTGGKQYRVMKGETLRVELLDAEAGSEIKFDNVLMLGDGEGVTLGDALKGALVTATIKSHGRADKVRIVKFRRRKHHRKQMGHRQHYTEIEITGIAGGDRK